MTLTKKDKKALEFLAIILYFFLTIFLCFHFHLRDIAGTILFFFIPSLYILIRHWNIHKHAITFSLIFGLITGLLVEVFAQTNNIWSYKPLPWLSWIQYHGMPLSAVFWYFLWFWFTICIYRIFADPHKHSLGHHHFYWKKHKHFTVLMLLIMVVFITVFLMAPHILVANYAYLKLLTPIFVLPILYICFKHPSMIPGLLKISMMSVIFYLIYEVVGLRLNWWQYNGLYIHSVHFLGVAFPVEELTLWILLGSVFVVSLYEEFELDLH